MPSVLWIKNTDTRYSLTYCTLCKMYMNGLYMISLNYRDEIWRRINNELYSQKYASAMDKLSLAHVSIKLCLSYKFILHWCTTLQSWNKLLKINSNKSQADVDQHSLQGSDCMIEVESYFQVFKKWCHWLTYQSEVSIFDNLVPTFII